jgi:hypothetical protein
MLDIGVMTQVHRPYVCFGTFCALVQRRSP